MEYIKREDLIKENNELKNRIRELEKILIFIRKIIIILTIIFLCATCFILGLGW